MRKLFFIVAFGLFATLLFINLVPAPGPNFHLNVTNTVLADPEVNDTLIAKIITENYDDCLSGLAYADVGIFEYYTNFKAYKSLHNYNTVEELLRLAKDDGDRAFAYCFKLHLSQDGISHNFYVPAAIKRTKLPNYIIHPITELKLEGNFLDPRATRLMERHAEFDELVAQASGRDWSDEAKKLNVILGGGEFYSKAYNPSSTTTFGKIQRGFFWIINRFVSEEDWTDLYRLSIEESKAVLRGETSSLDPSGEAALLAADKETQLWLYLGTFIVIILVFVVSFKKKWIGFK